MKKVLQLRKKETPTHEFFCEICDIFKNAFFEEHLQTTAPKSFVMCPIMKTLVALSSQFY